jgi:hypothetical protein
MLPLSRSVLQEVRLCQKERPVRVDSALPDQKGATLLPAYAVMQGLVPGKPVSGSAHVLLTTIFFMKPLFADC